MLILKNCRLIPELMEGFEESYADIVIEGKVIEAIYPAKQESLEAGTVIDIGNKTVVPGFFDLHAHLMFVNQDYNAMLMRKQNQYLLDSLKYVKSYLKHGYTTVRDCGNDFYTGIAVRDAVESGLIQGARVITSGKILSPTTRGNECFGSLYLEFDNPDDALHLCREEIRQGVQFIKYMVTGAVLNEGGVPGAMVATPEEIAAMVDAANTLGTYIAAHCHGKEGIKQSIIYGIRTIEHATYIDSECIELIHKHGNKSAIVPTFSIMYTLVNKLFDGVILEEFRQKAADAEKNAYINVKLAYESNVDVGWGTDIDREMFERYPGLEFMARKQLGLTNTQLLKQATIDSAKIAGIADKCGTIKVGKYADLAVIDGKPDEDISVMEKLPAHVFKEGKLIQE
ncbi:MAG: amidohydrolase family protein [Clostridiaceae bacterium]|nr:amidohydrolase family protein [Clostridiaceae bacterium]